MSSAAASPCSPLSSRGPSISPPRNMLPSESVSTRAMRQADTRASTSPFTCTGNPREAPLTIRREAATASTHHPRKGVHGEDQHVQQGDGGDDVSRGQTALGQQHRAAEGEERNQHWHRRPQEHAHRIEVLPPRQVLQLSPADTQTDTDTHTLTGLDRSEQDRVACLRN